ncbi:hypothetical protein DXG01_004970 [Tephrocybe rancida]|nr:hypothetical protein DXG01_004970 [Tephrocybe rancida]
MATLTVTEVRRRRPRAQTISVIVSKSLITSVLPTEIFLLILEHAILRCKLRDLALVCKAFCRALDVIIYRTVVLDTPKTLHLVHRTTLSKRPTFFTDHVKKLVVTDHDIISHSSFYDILAACSGVRSLIIPSFSWPQKLSAHAFVTPKSIEGMNIHVARQAATAGFLDDLTHLRFCEPSDVWCSPTAMVEAFGPLPNLSHLQLARRVNANQANDKLFVTSISELLVARPTLKMLVISIFPDGFGIDNRVCIEESDIWFQLCELCRTDQRLLVVPGHYEELKDEWNEPQAIRSGWHPRDFWLHSLNIANVA